MAAVYILHSENLDKFYIGSCKNLEERLAQHLTKEFAGFTSNADDWKLFYSIKELHYQQARNIEQHIKKMKSRKYLENLLNYPEITQKLIQKYKS